MTAAASVQSTPAQRWLARLSFLLAGLAIVILVLFAELKSLAMFAVGLVAAVVSVTAAFFFLSRRGIVRWLSLGLFVLVPIAVIVVFAVGGVLWVAIVSAGVWLLAGVTARRALSGNRLDWRMPEHPAQPPPRYPYLIMNPKSGGGKVEQFDLKRKAEALGAEVDGQRRDQPQPENRPGKNRHRVVTGGQIGRGDLGDVAPLGQEDDTETRSGYPQERRAWPPLPGRVSPFRALLAETRYPQVRGPGQEQRGHYPVHQVPR